MKKAKSKRRKAGCCGDKMKRYDPLKLVVTHLRNEIVAGSPAVEPNGAGDDNAGYDIDWFN